MNNLTNEQNEIIRQALISAGQDDMANNLFPVSKIQVIKAIRESFKSVTSKSPSLKSIKDFVDFNLDSQEKQSNELALAYGRPVSTLELNYLVSQNRFQLQIDSLKQSARISKAESMVHSLVNLTKSASVVKDLNFDDREYLLSTLYQIMYTLNNPE